MNPVSMPTVSNASSQGTSVSSKSNDSFGALLASAQERAEASKPVKTPDSRSQISSKSASQKSADREEKKVRTRASAAPVHVSSPERTEVTHSVPMASTPMEPREPASASTVAESEMNASAASLKNAKALIPITLIAGQPLVASTPLPSSSSPETPSQTAFPQSELTNPKDDGGEYETDSSKSADRFANVGLPTASEQSVSDLQPPTPDKVSDYKKQKNDAFDAQTSGPDQPRAAQSGNTDLSLEVALKAAIQATTAAGRASALPHKVDDSTSHDSDLRANKPAKPTGLQQKAASSDLDDLKAALAGGLSQFVAKKSGTNHHVPLGTAQPTVPETKSVPKAADRAKSDVRSATENPSDKKANGRPDASHQGAQVDSEPSSQATNDNSSVTPAAAATNLSRDEGDQAPLPQQPGPVGPSSSADTAKTASAQRGTQTAFPLPSAPQNFDLRAPAIGVSNASLIERFRQSELNFAMRSGEFGHIEVHTVLSPHEVSARISVERSELGHALNSEVPILQKKLDDLNFSTTKITVLDQSAALQTGSERQSSGQQPQQTTPVQESQAVRELTKRSAVEAQMEDEGLSIRI